MSWESISTESTSDASCGSITTGYISIPQTDSSVDVNIKTLEIEGKSDRYKKTEQDYRVIAARNVSTETKNCPDCFVEITILPESRVNSKCISTIYHKSFKPVFDEKISMELPIDFQSKRLFIRLWHARLNSRGHEFLGCMSFGLHRAYGEAQLASGWYYILDEEVGMRRHVKVIDNTDALRRYPTNVSKVLLCRNEDGGFGFSIIGSHPVRICRVKSGSTAELHNLQPNDAILTIDVYDARNLSSVEVASIIRNIKNFTCMVIQRGPQYISDKNEDRIKNGVVAKLIKKIFYDKTKANEQGSSKNVLVDYGWLENKSHNEENLCRIAGQPSSSHLNKNSGCQLQQSASLQSSYSRNSINLRMVSSLQKQDIAKKTRVHVKRWHSLKEDMVKTLDEVEAFDNNVVESHFCQTERNALSPVAEGDSALLDSLSRKSNGSCESRTMQVIPDSPRRKFSKYKDKSINKPGSSTNSLVDGLLANDYQYAYENPSLFGMGNQSIVKVDSDEAGNVALDSSKFSFCEDDHKENTPLLLFKKYDSNPTHSCETYFAKKRSLLTSRENLPPLIDNYLNSPISVKDNTSSHDIPTPCSLRQHNKSRAVVSRMRTLFKNKHAS